MTTSDKTNDRHFKTRKNAAAARSVYTRKRRAREAAELEKSSLLDRTGKNIQKLYGHPIWGKVAGVATVMLLTILATKTGEALKRHGNVNVAAADKVVESANIAQGVISSPAGLVNLFRHLYTSMTAGANSVEGQSGGSTKTDGGITELTTKLVEAANDPGKVLIVRYGKDGSTEYVLEQRNATIPPIEDVSRLSEEDWAAQHSGHESSAPISPDHESSDSFNLSAFYNVLARLFTPDDLARFCRKHHIRIEVSSASTASPDRHDPVPTYSDIISRLSDLSALQIKFLVEKLGEIEDSGLVKKRARKRQMMLILKVLWMNNLSYTGSDVDLTRAIELVDPHELGDSSDDSYTHDPHDSLDLRQRAHDRPRSSSVDSLDSDVSLAPHTFRSRSASAGSLGHDAASINSSPMSLPGSTHAQTSGGDMGGTHSEHSDYTAEGAFLEARALGIDPNVVSPVRGSGGEDPTD